MGQAIYDFFNTVAYVPFLLETLVFFYLIKPVKWQIPLIVLLFIPDIFYPYAQLAFLIIMQIIVVIFSKKYPELFGWNIAYYISILVTPSLAEGVAGIIELIAKTFFHTYLDHFQINWIAGLATLILLLAIFKFLDYRRFNFKKVISFDGQNISFIRSINWVIFSLTLAVLTVEIALYFSENAAIIAAWFILIFVAIANLYQAIRQNKKYMNALIKKAELKQIQEYSERLEQANMSLRKARHDYKNSLLGLNGYLLENDVDGAKKYLAKIIGESDQAQNASRTMTLELSNLKIKELKYLVIEKLQKAQDEHIKVKAEVNQEITKLPGSIVTLIKAAGILLDNAVEACDGQTNPWLNFLLTKYGKNVYSLAIQNSISHKLDVQQILRAGFSSKDHHSGLGLANLNEMVNNDPNLSLEIKQTDKQISFELLIQEVN